MSVSAEQCDAGKMYIIHNSIDKCVCVLYSFFFYPEAGHVERGLEAHEVPGNNIEIKIDVNLHTLQFFVHETISANDACDWVEGRLVCCHHQR